MQESHNIKAMFDNIANKYDFLNHLLSLGLDFCWRKELLNALYPLDIKSIICDLATGTGDSAKVIIKKGFKVVGVDLSLKMIKISKKKLSKKSFFPLCGSGYQLPFKDETFDAVTCAFGIRNMHSIDKALIEIFRILKKGGKAVILEFSLPSGAFKIFYSFYMKYILPNIAALFSEKEAYEYLWNSICNFPSTDEFSDLLIKTGFLGIEQKSMSFGTVYIHKAYKF